MVLIILGIAFILVAITFLLKNKKSIKSLDIILKIMVIVYLCVAIARFFLADSFIYVINKGLFENYYYETTDFFHSFLRWGCYLSYGVLPIAVFYNSRVFRNIAIYFCLPITIFATFYFNDFMVYFMAKNARGITTSEIFRQIHFSIELILAIVIPLMLMVIKKHHFKVKSIKEWLRTLGALPFVVLALIPVYLPQSLFGYTNIDITALTLGNIVWILLILIELFALYMIFRFKSYEQRHMICVFLAIALFMHYNSLFITGFLIKRLPIQLCNLGTYFILLALIIKKRAFSNFVFIANIVGTMIAIGFPDISNGIFGFWNYHFILEHSQVFVIPMLAMLLRLFPRLEKDALKHVFIGFSCYFFFCLITGTLLNSFVNLTGQGHVNFFYIFDVERAVGWVPFLWFTQKYPLQISSTYEIYPLFQLIIFTAFSLLCFTMYYIMTKVYKIVDDNFRLRRARIELEEKITGKPSKFQKDYTD